MIVIIKEGILNHSLFQQSRGLPFLETVNDCNYQERRVTRKIGVRDGHLSISK